MHLRPLGHLSRHLRWDGARSTHHRCECGDLDPDHRRAWLLKKISRREWDSNPRSRKQLNGFRDRPIRPLSHLSETQDGSRSAKYTDVPEPTRTSLESFVPKRIRTSGLWIRNPMLYPAELWAHATVSTGSLSGSPALARPRHPYLRRGGDSNPRYPFGVQRLSRAPDSATLAPLQFKPPRWAGERDLKQDPSTVLARVEPRGGGNVSGEGGIRTPGTAKRLNGFQDRLLRPLGHLSREQKTRLQQGAHGKERQRISLHSSHR